jgi:hypothetical protein
MPGSTVSFLLWDSCLFTLTIFIIFPGSFTYEFADPIWTKEF